MLFEYMLLIYYLKSKLLFDRSNQFYRKRDKNRIVIYVRVDIYIDLGESIYSDIFGFIACI